MTVKELKDSFFENYHQRMGFAKKQLLFNETSEKKKDLQLFATKLTEKVPDPCNAKNHCQSFLRKKNIKLVKQSKIITAITAITAESSYQAFSCQ